MYCLNLLSNVCIILLLGALKQIGKKSPFGVGSNEGVNEGFGDLEWVVNKDRSHYDELYNSLEQTQGKATRTGTGT